MIGRQSADAEVQSPVFGVLGGIPLSNVNPRVDFDPGEFAAQIEAHGKRLAWTRALRCPCAPLNEQTGQTDPTCPMCRGVAWTYFGAGQPQNLPEQSLTPAQQQLLRISGAFVIRGVLTGFGKQDKPWDRIGSWRMGAAAVTVRSENRLGFNDRLTVLDDRLVFSEVIDVTEDASAPLPLRYLVAGGIYRLASTRRALQAGVDFRVQGGRVRLLRPLAAEDRRLGAVYVTFPTFLVQDIPNVSRETSVRDVEGGAQTGIGASIQLPVRATLRLEFLPNAFDPQDAP